MTKYNEEFYDGKVRCEWSMQSEGERIYHDTEWGKATKDDRTLYEFLLLESMQAGLSWSTILNKRENFREAFDGFDWTKVAKYDDEDYERLINDAGIVRNKLKIRAAINNAKRFSEILEEFGSFYGYISTFTGGEQIINKWKSIEEVPAKTMLSDAVSKDLKKRGFSFVGTTIVYAFLQATGFVNDHLVSCEYRSLD